MQTGSLGDTIFEVSGSRVFTPQTFAMNREARFEEHQVQGTWPRPEYLAPGLAACSLSIVLRRDLGCEPFEEVEKLEESLVKGEVMRLVIAGKNLGRWTIRKIDQSWRSVLKNSSGPMTIALGLELREYI